MDVRMECPHLEKDEEVDVYMDLENFPEDIIRPVTKKVKIQGTCGVLGLPLHQKVLAVGGASCRHSAEGK